MLTYYHTITFTPTVDLNVLWKVEKSLLLKQFDKINWQQIWTQTIVSAFQMWELVAFIVNWMFGVFVKQNQQL